MIKRDEVLYAVRRAAEVTGEFDARKRIAAGYTRVDPDAVAHAAGVLVLYRPLDRLLGGFLREEGAAGIIVNMQRSRGLLHMTCAHELGHYFLDHESTADETVDYGNTAGPQEQQANFFAYNLLASQWLIAATMRRKGWSRADLTRPLVVYQMSLRLGISYSGMVWSLVRIGFLGLGDTTALLRVQPRTMKLEALAGADLLSSINDVWVLSTADKDSIIEPALGDQFVVDLPNHADSGHLWSADELRSEGFLLEPVVQDARTAPSQGSRVVVGRTAETMRYHLKEAQSQNPTSQSGDRQTISLRETTPWSTQAAALNEWCFGAEFEALTSGYSRAERANRLSQVKAVE